MDFVELVALLPLLELLLRTPIPFVCFSTSQFEFSVKLHSGFTKVAQKKVFQ